MQNYISIHGYLGRDPELTEQTGQNGPYKKCNFSVGVSRDFGDETDWFYCVIYGKRAEVVEKFFHKGSEIIVSGRMESYTPKKHQDMKSWVLMVEKFDFAGKKDKEGSNDVPDGFTEVEDEDEEDVPFQ